MRKFLGVGCVALGCCFLFGALGAKAPLYGAAALFYFGAARHWLRTA